MAFLLFRPGPCSDPCRGQGGAIAFRPARSPRYSRAMTPEAAEILSLEGLGWLAGDDEALTRFLAASGSDMTQLRQDAGRRDTQLAVLAFLLEQEDLMLRFCTAANVAPQSLHLAHHALEGHAG